MAQAALWGAVVVRDLTVRHGQVTRTRGGFAFWSIGHAGHGQLTGSKLSAPIWSLDHASGPPRAPTRPGKAVSDASPLPQRR